MAYGWAASGWNWVRVVGGGFQVVLAVSKKFMTKPLPETQRRFQTSYLGHPTRKGNPIPGFSIYPPNQNTPHRVFEIGSTLPNVQA